MAKGVPIHKLAHPHAPLRESAPILIVRLQEMLEWATAIQDPACVEELHNMRIAAKRLRYTLEIFLPTLGPDAPVVLKTVEEIQEQIGAIHDCDVLIPVISDTMEKEMERERKIALRGDGPPPYVAAEGLSKLLARKRNERERRYHDFLAFWNALPPEAFAERVTGLIVRATTAADYTD